jgi:signal transduction histidine kinase
METCKVLFVSENKDAREILDKALLEQEFAASIEVEFTFDGALEALASGRHEICFIQCRHDAADRVAELTASSQEAGLKIPIAVLSDPETSWEHHAFISAGAIAVLTLDTSHSDWLSGLLRLAMMLRRTEVKLRNTNDKLVQDIFTLQDARERAEGLTAQYVEMLEHFELAKIEAERANSAKSDFLAHMSHELLTPLNAIIGFSETIMGQLFGPIGHEKYAEYIMDISNSGKHLHDLIKDMLDITAIEANKIVLHESEIDVPALVDVSTRFVEIRAKEEGVTVVQDVAEDLPRLYADDRRMKQILVNLLVNAVKFTPEGGTVTISATISAEGGHTFSVVDTGIGMTEDELGQAMQPFVQVRRGMQQAKHEGTGLGLPLTKALVEMHGGTLSVQSEKGVGTAITVQCPADRVVAQDGDAPDFQAVFGS